MPKIQHYLPIFSFSFLPFLLADIVILAIYTRLYRTYEPNFKQLAKNIYLNVILVVFRYCKFAFSI